MKKNDDDKKPVEGKVKEGVDKPAAIAGVTLITMAGITAILRIARDETGEDDDGER